MYMCVHSKRYDFRILFYLYNSRNGSSSPQSNSKSSSSWPKRARQIRWLSNRFVRATIFGEPHNHYLFSSHFWTVINVISSAVVGSGWKWRHSDVLTVWLFSRGIGWIWMVGGTQEGKAQHRKLRKFHTFAMGNTTLSPPSARPALTHSSFIYVVCHSGRQMKYKYG